MPSLACRSDAAGNVCIPLILATTLKSGMKWISHMREMWILRPVPIYSSLSPRKLSISCMAVQRDKVHPRTGHEGPDGEYMYSCTLSLTSAIGGEWVVNATPMPLYPRERPCTHCIEGWLGPRARLEGSRKIRLPTGIRSPVRPASSESVYRLSVSVK